MTETVKTAVTDLASLDTVASCEEGAVMEVRHPKTNEVLRHDDGRPFTITFRGRDSEVMRDVARKQQDRRAAAYARTRSMVTSAVSERDDVELIVAATIKWDIVYGGGVAKCDPNLYREAYTKLPWLKEQGDEFVGVRANFIKS